MNEAQIDEAFGSITPDWPIWKAICELVDREIDDATELSSQYGLEDHKRQFAAGRLHQAILLRNILRGRMESIQRRSGSPTSFTGSGAAST